MKREGRLEWWKMEGAFRFSVLGWSVVRSRVVGGRFATKEVLSSIFLGMMVSVRQLSVSQSKQMVTELAEATGFLAICSWLIHPAVYISSSLDYWSVAKKKLPVGSLYN